MEALASAVNLPKKQVSVFLMGNTLFHVRVSESLIPVHIVIEVQESPSLHFISSFHSSEIFRVVLQTPKLWQTFVDVKGICSLDRKCPHKSLLHNWRLISFFLSFFFLRWLIGFIYLSSLTKDCPITLFEVFLNSAFSCFATWITEFSKLSVAWFKKIISL